MYQSDDRSVLLSKHSGILGSSHDIKDSHLLQIYSTFWALKNTAADLEISYQDMHKKYSSYVRAILHSFRPPFSESFAAAVDDFTSFTLEEFLTYIVPGLVCDPQRVINTAQKYFLNSDNAILIHHIIQIRLVAYRLDNALIKKEKLNDHDNYDDVLEKIYLSYKSVEKNHPLPKDVFLGLYSSINTYQLDPKSIAPRALGFSNNDISDLLSILTDQLQMTKSQQIEMTYRFFVKREQAHQIISNQELYNFIVCRSEKERERLATKALRLIAKISPLELICAITTRKKSGATNIGKRLEGFVAPNDVTLETGLLYPIFRTNLSVAKDTRIGIFNPSPYFIRKILNDTSLKDRSITFVLQDERIVQLLCHQFKNEIYAPRIGANISVISSATLSSQLSGGSMLPYQKVFLFCNGLPVSEQQILFQEVLNSSNSVANVYALLAAYPIEKAIVPFITSISISGFQLHSIALIPQGINNSTQPRRKIWIHCTRQQALPDSDTKIYAFTLNNSLKTQAIAPMLEEPVTLSPTDALTLDTSIRDMFAQEMIKRRSSGRERKVAFSHEITPDIDVWCSRTYPKANGDRPRLEAYVCLPPSPKKVSCGFTPRGSVIQSTKKHTTSVPDSKVLEWLENEYPFSKIRGRQTPVDQQSLESKYPLKQEIQIRDEIIAHYKPVLQGHNIALKTLWYLYPSLQDRYSPSDYAILCEMMHATIGQTRVADITPEICEDLLTCEYPDLSQASLWRYYAILVAMIDAAISFGHCSHNPLCSALNQSKVRDKLFAQVRQALVKKHFSEFEMQKLYEFVQQKIREGEPEYFGVLVRLLTGLESNILCALRWCDLRHSPECNVSTFIITRQLTADGTEITGFSDEEDYLCFPIPEGIRSTLLAYQKDYAVLAHNDPILNSISSVGGKRRTAITPEKLNRLTKKAIAHLQIDERTVILPDSNYVGRKTNLNKYSGDLIRENFRYWATKTAKLNADELSYLLRNKAPSTLGRYYCDFLNDASQLIVSTKLSRWEASISNIDLPVAYQHDTVQETSYYSKTQPIGCSRQEVILELHGCGQADICIQSHLGIETDFWETTRKEK